MNTDINLDNQLTHLNNTFISHMNCYNLLKIKNSELKQAFFNLKSQFQSSFKDTINDLEDVINLTNQHLESNQKDSSKQSNTEINDEDKSPASIWTNYLIFSDGTNVFKHTGSTARTFTINTVLKSNFNFSMRLNKFNASSPSYVVFGVSNREIDEPKGYLGQDFGKGNWGIAGCKFIGEEGVNTSKGSSFKEGDIITFSGNCGIITYRINDEFNDYSYNIGDQNLYPAFTFFTYDDEIELF